ncbi:glycosyltransferase [Lysinibacillus irui]|uniref:Glycosyltransferase n=1 Tax=Lysinibacillus irui TaxID=2998077 RepID=A0AAJ5RRY0_9BACI|nr:glycosyltransferase [Lysinibacillus irui]WDV07878.1 glycosyltransferase [Lysinibacillus irui]
MLRANYALSTSNKFKSKDETIQKKIKITHIITTIGLGGAEAMLYRLLQNMDRNVYEVEVICLTEMGTYGKLIEQQLHIKVSICDMRSNSIRAVLDCYRLCRGSDIIQTWMYHANLLGYILSILLKKKLIWGIHHSNLNKKENKRRTIFIAKLCARLSKRVDAIISCGPKVKEIHEAIGYKGKQHHVIVNGINTDEYMPSKKRYYYMEQFGIKNQPILLHVGRWDPLKDYENLIASLKWLRQLRQNFYLFLVGYEIDTFNKELMLMIEEAQLQQVTFLLGSREDVPQLMAAADLFVLSSAGEGLPNVLVEALASGTCCVTTNVGDCEYLVGDYGEVVSAKDPKALAMAINKALNYSSQQYAERAGHGREHALANFQIKQVVAQYHALYPTILDEKSS